MSIIGTLPNTIANGDPLDATPVMADFNWIVSQVNGNAAPLASPTFSGVVTSPGGINFGGSTLASYVENTFAPTVTLVGGAGNTVPVYTTNTGRYERIGNRAFVDVYLNGDGGAEGAGTGVLTIGLPITSGASNPAGSIICGIAVNGATNYLLAGSIGAGGGVISLSYFATVSALASMTGDDQNNTSRTVRLSFFYEV